MLLFFIYAALGVELFGRLGECGHSVPLPKGGGDMQPHLTSPQVDGESRVPA